MKLFKLVLLSGLAILCFVMPLIAQDEHADHPENDQDIIIHKYNDHLYRFSVPSAFQINVYASIGDDGILLVDTGLPQDADKTLKAIRSISDAPVNTIIITHTHQDHLGGLPLMGGEAKIIAHENAMEDRYYSLEPNKLFKGETVSVKDTMTIRFNDETIRIETIPPGHFDDDIIVHFVDSNVLCIGGLMTPNNYFYVDYNVGGTMDAVLDQIKKQAEKHKDAVFAPGHGVDINSEQALAYHEAMMESIDFIKGKLKEGISRENLLEIDILKEWDSYTSAGISHAFWINLVARSMGSEDEALTPIVEPLTKTLEAESIEAMFDQYKKLKTDKPDDFNYGEAQLNMLGYQLIYRNRLDEALKVLKLNMDEFPESANVYDSYGEVLLTKGDTTKAIEYYERALEVDSTFRNARIVLDRIKGN